MKNKVNEANVIISKTDYKSDQGLAQTARKNKDNLVAVDDNKVKKMVDTNTGTQTTAVSNSTSPTTSTIGVTENETQIDAVIEPQDQETIKYLSNVKDPDTGEISKPFTIGDKNYQMVRGMKPNREIVLGVLCLDEMNEMGGHKIHGVEHFEKTIAIPMRDRHSKMHSQEQPNQDKEKFIDHLNLSDVNGFKHFFVNRNTNEVTSRFKSIGEMIKSGAKLGIDEDYMDAKNLRRSRYQTYFKPNMNEADDEGVKGVEGTDVDKLKADVKKLTQLISNKFSTAISKINKPVEQVEFLSAMAEIIGVPFNKLTSLINSFRDVASQQKKVNPTPEVSESKIIKKDVLLESLGVKQTIIKVNKNKNERK